MGPFTWLSRYIAPNFNQVKHTQAVLAMYRGEKVHPTIVHRLKSAIRRRLRDEDYTCRLPTWKPPAPKPRIRHKLRKYKKHIERRKFGFGGRVRKSWFEIVEFYQ